MEIRRANSCSVRNSPPPCAKRIFAWVLAPSSAVPSRLPTAGFDWLFYRGDDGRSQSRSVRWRLRPDERGVVPRELGERIGKFLQPPIVREATVVELTARERTRSPGHPPIPWRAPDPGARHPLGGVSAPPRTFLLAGHQYLLVATVTRCTRSRCNQSRPRVFRIGRRSARMGRDGRGDDPDAARLPVRRDKTSIR